MEYVDGDILFVPQICERAERRILERALKPGDTFFDIGCHTGFYSLFVSQLVGRDGRVYAIDADEHSISRLKENIALNCKTNILPIHSGVSTRHEVLPFGLNLRGNRGASSFRRAGQATTRVPCYPLLHFMRQYGVGAVRGAKLDIEEMGYDVLRHFFDEADVTLYPQILIVEKEDGLREFLGTRGYRMVAESGLNWSFNLERRGPGPMR